jgi:hypothetical protein
MKTLLEKAESTIEIIQGQVKILRRESADNFKEITEKEFQTRVNSIHKETQKFFDATSKKYGVSIFPYKGGIEITHHNKSDDHGRDKFTAHKDIKR